MLKNLALLTLLFAVGCTNAIPESKSIFPKKLDTTSSAKIGVSLAAGSGTNGTHKLVFSVNMINGSMPSSNGTDRVRVADPEVMHHAY